MNIETIYLMTENGRFVCTNQFGDLTIEKKRANESCKLRAGFGEAEPTVALYSAQKEQFWAIAPDPGTPHVEHLISTRKDSWTTFSYEYADADETVLTLRDADGRYVSRVDIGRPYELLAASGASADDASRFRVIRFADDDH